MDKNNKQKKKWTVGRVLYVLALVALIGLFLFSAGALLKYYMESRQSKETYQQLQELKGDYTRPSLDPSGDQAQTYDPENPPTEPPENLVTVTDPETGEEVKVLAELAELYKLNNDLVGWLAIPGTNVDYPVVQRTESTDYYLHRDFHKNYDPHGCLYAREVCDVAAPSDNITIYGHRMLDGSMFADLVKYQNKDYWQENQYLYFDTLTEHHTYQIVYVFTTTATVGEGFTYHQFVDAETPEQFNEFTAECLRWSVFDTGLSATYGDKLITLSTCEYSYENGRLVVVAKRIN